jgi:hypothetical protein
MARWKRCQLGKRRREIGSADPIHDFLDFGIDRRRRRRARHDVKDRFVLCDGPYRKAGGVLGDASGLALIERRHEMPSFVEQDADIRMRALKQPAFLGNQEQRLVLLYMRSGRDSLEGSSGTAKPIPGSHVGIGGVAKVFVPEFEPVQSILLDHVHGSFERAFIRAICCKLHVYLPLFMLMRCHAAAFPWIARLIEWIQPTGTTRPRKGCHTMFRYSPGV